MMEEEEVHYMEVGVCDGGGTGETNIDGRPCIVEYNRKRVKDVNLTGDTGMESTLPDSLSPADEVRAAAGCWQATPDQY